MRPKGYWKDLANRKRFFEKLAEQEGFNPSVPTNWKTVTRRQVEAIGKVLILFS